MKILSRLKVALVHYDNPRQFDRAVGFWSYAVPEFEVTHFGIGRDSSVRRSEYKSMGFDLIFREDHKCFGRLKRDAVIPAIYYIVDSPASKDHYKIRLRTAPQHDLLLIEQDKLSRFQHLNIPTRRLGYCVNDEFFKDYELEKDVDICFHARPIDQRRKDMHQWLTEFCSQQGYKYMGGKRSKLDYPYSFNRAKISVNTIYNSSCRNHRVFDVMASRSCLVTDTLPMVSGEKREPGEHYVEFGNWEQLADVLTTLMANGKWREIADRSYELVRQYHTWATRAQELRQIIFEEFKI